MLFFGHIGITVLIGTLFFLPALIVGISSILPDLVDKGLLAVGLSQYSRLYAHNIFFGPIASAIVYLVTRRKSFALAVLFGTYVHLLEDIRTPLPWLWPLVKTDIAPADGLKISPDIFDLAMETIGLSCLASLFVFRKTLLAARERLLSAFKEFYDRRIVKKI